LKSLSPIIIQVTRGDRIESFHQAFVVIVDKQGKTIYSSGDENYITCFRSSLKPFQASAAIKCEATSKAQFTSKEIALMCASHSGEKIHIETAKGMLDKLGYTPNDYECGAHPAHDISTRHQMIKSEITHNAMHNNCSGKHAGMLCLAKYTGDITQGYIDKNHIVQKMILEQVIRIAEKPPNSFGIDGCSVPTPFYDLKTIAVMFQKLGSGDYEELTTAYKAMSLHPHLVAGYNRFDTEFIKTMKGRAISKGGGEAIQGISLQTKKYGPVGIALKVIDGSHRVRDVAIMSALTSLNLLTTREKQQLHKFSSVSIINYNGIETGKIKVS
jgi:L-asparaginase II